MSSIALVDGTYMMHRSMYASTGKLTDSQGRPTGTAYGVLQSMRNVCNILRPRSIIFIMDASRSKRRMELYPEYKANRKAKEMDEKAIARREALNFSTPLLEELIPLLGMKFLKLQGQEGDDVIHLFTRILDGYRSVVVSEDSDMIQMVREAVHIYQPISGRYIEPGNFTSELGYPSPAHALLHKCLTGDSSDNITGVPGVGKKTADKIVEITKDPELLFETVEAYEGKAEKRIKKILEAKDIYMRNRELIDLAEQEFSEEEYEAARITLNSPASRDHNKLLDFLYEYEMTSITKDFSNWIYPFEQLR